MTNPFWHLTVGCLGYVKFKIRRVDGCMLVLAHDLLCKKTKESFVGTVFACHL